MAGVTFLDGLLTTFPYVSVSLLYVESLLKVSKVYSGSGGNLKCLKS